MPNTAPALTPFRPEIPAFKLQDRRKVVFFHHPMWSSEAWTEILLAYARTFNPFEDVMLVLYLDPAQGVSEEEAASRITQVLADAGFPDAQTPDLLLVADDLDLDGLASLYASADCVVPHQDALQRERAGLMGKKILADLEPQTWGMTAGTFNGENPFSHGITNISQLLNPMTLARIAGSTDNWREIMEFFPSIVTDAYSNYNYAFYQECLRRFGADWWHLDLVNVIYATAKTIRPKNYLEIGVRRGKSLSTVVRGCPTVNVVGFDLWIPNYAGINNPGPDFVAHELVKHGHQGSVQFISGDSHQTVPQYFKENPGAMFDLINVDGDHSEAGALDDLRNVIPHLAVGGVLVFDDISHPLHPFLLDVWHRILAEFPFLAGYEYTDMGSGVAFAIRRG